MASRAAPGFRLQSLLTVTGTANRSSGNICGAPNFFFGYTVWCMQAMAQNIGQACPLRKWGFGIEYNYEAMQSFSGLSHHTL